MINNKFHMIKKLHKKPSKLKVFNKYYLQITISHNLKNIILMIFSIL